MDEQIKFIIAGKGNIANTYLSAISKLDNSVVVGFISRSADQQGLPMFRSIEEIDIPFDAVIVCTPNGLHHVITVQAAKLGKHVLCEKPIDIALDKIDLMINTCMEEQVKLGVAYQRRYSSDNPVMKSLIDKGELGRVFSVDLSIKNYRDDNYYNSSPYRGTYAIDGGGPFIQQASHYIDLYQWFFGKPNKIASTLATFIHDIEVEDHGAAICTHDNGMISTITASTATKPGFPAKMEIYSTKGFLVLENDVITQWEIEGIDNPSISDETTNQHTGSATAVVADTTNHERIVKDFSASILEDRDPLVTGPSARVATEMILEIYDSRIEM